MVFAVTHDTESKIYTDLSEQFPVISKLGNRYISIFYYEDSNAILSNPMNNISNSAMSASYKNIIKTSCIVGFKPSF